MTEKLNENEKVEGRVATLVPKEKPVKRGETDLHKMCRTVLKLALIDLGLTRQKADEIAKSDFMRNNVDIKFACGRLVIDKGLVRRKALKNIKTGA